VIISRRCGEEVCAQDAALGRPRRRRSNDRLTRVSSSFYRRHRRQHQQPQQQGPPAQRRRQVNCLAWLSCVVARAPHLRHRTSVIGAGEPSWRETRWRQRRYLPATVIKAS